MNLSSSLSLRQKRSLAMTSQLRQAIALLQFNNSELHDFLAEKAKENPFLEVRPPASASQSFAPGTPSEAARRDAARSSQDNLGDNVAGPAPGLAEHVTEQIRISIPDTHQRHIAFAFLEAIEPYGWLGETVETVAAEAGCSVPEAELVLDRLQQFEPHGLFARSLSECLRLQAREQGVLDETLHTLLENLSLVADGDLGTLAAMCRCDTQEIRDRLAILRQFDPKPGNAFATDASPIRPPDLLLIDKAGGWAVELNGSTLPEIVVRDDLVHDRTHRDAFVAEALAGARGLKRAIEQRNANTLAAASEIVRRQSAFLSDRTAFLAPMKLQDVADAVELHPSTVSRVTNAMTIETPRGVMDLRQFFTRGLPARSGETAISTAEIMERIRKMIDGEARAKPLSDATIAARLQADGIQIQRRTVAKYRIGMRIPGSSRRRRETAHPSLR